MAKRCNIHNDKKLTEKEHLFYLINQAGQDARVRKQKVMVQHAEKLRVVIAEAISRKNKIVSL